MIIPTQPYHQSLLDKPATGKQIIGHHTKDSIVVYQAYKPAIADYAVKHQHLGGDSFNYERMSWIKPGFLWMMYRCGWATKDDQERILALWIRKDDFKKILSEAVPTTYKPKQYSSKEAWTIAMKQKEVRLQWDPDHDPYGRKQERKAIQLGLKGNMLKAFGTEYIKRVDDITDFVTDQRQVLDENKIDHLHVPIETVMEIDDPVIAENINLK